MTNLQEGAPRISAPILRRVWLWVPIGIGAALAAALAASLLAPLWVSLQRDSERLREVEALTARLSDERLRAKRLSEQEEKVGAQRASLIRVISGNGDVSTFLAKLDQLAKQTGVQLDLYEPTAVSVDLDRNKDGRVDDQEKQAKPPQDPLEVEGMQRNSLVMSARGNFPQLLSFLRQLEALNVLVVQSDLQLNLEPKSGAQPVPIGDEPVLMKMALSLYSKKADPADGGRAGKMNGQAPTNPPPNGAPGAAATPN